MSSPRESFQVLDEIEAKSEVSDCEYPFSKMGCLLPR